jgi:regulatory protein
LADKSAHPDQPMDNPYYERLVNASLRFVSYRPRSEKELSDFLTKKLIKWNVSGTVLIIKVIERMRELGYVDDRAFAAWWCDQRANFKPKGRRYIAMELARKGVAREIIEEIGEIDEITGAKVAINKKIVLWARKPIIEQKKKMYTFLAQRGFSADTIQKIIDESVKKA